MSTPVAERGSARPRGGGIGRAAVLIGAITMLARVIGFGRQVVFAHTVQASCLGTAYTTANMVPNIIYDIVAGGALTAVVVPVLAGPVRSDPEQVRRTSAALLSWAVLLLVPVSLIIAAIARPLVSVLLGGTPGCPRADMVTLGARMLVVFAPQILLYGLAVVLYGILQAHRRFAAPALAPVLSSLVVIGAYFWFGVVGGGYQDLARPVPTLAWIVLAVGTTAGVAALVATPLIPAVRLHLRLRPSLRFPPGIGARVRTLAAAGVATLIAQDASVAVVIVLANSRGGSGALVLYSFAWAVFFVPYAVLAVPIATSAFPELSARADSFDATSATSTRAVMVASWLGVAGMAGTCVPLARVFQSHVSQAADARQLAIALAAFAPGLVGYGLMANLSRVLYAEGSKGRSRAAALAVSGGWLLVIVADLVIVPLVPRSAVVPWLGAGTTLGLTGSGVALLFLVRRFRGRDALRRLRACHPGRPGRRGGRNRGRPRRGGRVAGDGFPAQRRRHAAGQRGRAGRLPRRGGGGRRRGPASGDAQGDPPMKVACEGRTVKVAFVLGTSTGGTARHVRTLAAGCAARGVAAGVFGPAQTDRDFGFSRLAGGQVSFTPVEIADRPRVAHDVRAIRRLRRLLAAWRPDVAHAHGLRAGALTAIALAFVRPTVYHRRPALVVTVHNAPPAGGATGAVYRVLERIVAARADSVLCVSPDLEERMRAAGARRVGRALVPAAAFPRKRAGRLPCQVTRTRPAPWCWPRAGSRPRRGSAPCWRRPPAGRTCGPSRSWSSRGRGRSPPT